MKLQELFKEPQHTSINELDLLAPKQVYVKMPTGQFILVSYRSTGSALGSATGEDDPTAFVNFKKVSPQEAKTLGLEQHLAPRYSGKLKPDNPDQKPDKGFQRPLVSPQRVQGGTPFDHPDINVIEFNKKDRDDNNTIPNSIMAKLIKWVQNGMKEGIDEGVNDPNIFKAVFMAGGPGAGKSYIAKQMLDGTGLRQLNSDIAFKWLMNKTNLRLDMPDDEKEERDQVRARAKEMTKSQEELYLHGRLGLIIDGTGKDIAKISDINKRLKGIGYETRMIFVNTDLDTALARNQDRAKQGDRTVDPAIATDAHKKVQNNMMAYQQQFGKKNFYVIDNSDGPPSDDRKQNFNFVWKDLRRFLNTPPSSDAAKKWIANARKPSASTGQVDPSLGQGDTDTDDTPFGSSYNDVGSYGNKVTRNAKTAGNLARQATLAKSRRRANTIDF
jgi:adenylate kinase family enzyme